MAWQPIEATPPHLTYLILSGFLISYTLFTSFIRNRLHLSEPPIALIVGIVVGPRVLGWLTPNFNGVVNCSNCPQRSEQNGWGWGDDVVQEITRIIVGIQVFSVGVELPKYYAERHWRSLAMMLGPIMTVGWLVCGLFVTLIFRTNFANALLVSACLTPTDPVLSASILSNSQFGERVPKRIKHLLSAESGCNDGTSFPFLFIAISLLIHASPGEAVKQWFLITILWQCIFGLLIGLLIGIAFNKILRFSETRGHTDEIGFTVFYLLLAMLCVGIGSTLGADDFLVAFGAGYGFARDGWFLKTVKRAHLPNIIDLLLNSAMFVYLGTIIPWFEFQPHNITPYVSPGRLVGFLVLVLLFRRLPVVLLLCRWIPDIKTWREAFFVGWFGPMGLGGLFLAIEARANLENGTSTPDKHPPEYGRPYTPEESGVYLVWPVVCFVVMGSTLVHGLSVLVMAVYSHFSRRKEDRAGLLAGETDPLIGMEHDADDSESEDSD